MNVQFSDIDSMMTDLKKAKVKFVRLQTVRYKTQITYESKGNKLNVPHMAFEIILTARVKDECWIYTRKIALIDMADDKRRLNTAKKHMDEAEAEMRSLLEKNKFEIGKGAYYG